MLKFTATSLFFLDCENFVFKMVGDNGRDMTYKECQDYVNALAPKAPASLTKQFTNVDVPNTSRFQKLQS